MISLGERLRFERSSVMLFESHCCAVRAFYGGLGCDEDMNSES